MKDYSKKYIDKNKRQARHIWPPFFRVDVTRCLFANIIMKLIGIVACLSVTRTVDFTGQRVHDGQTAENSRGWRYLEFEIYAFDNEFTNSQTRRN